MKHEIDLKTWKRREHFEVFKNFDEPLFGITVRVECSAAYKKAKQSGYPFSNYYLYLSLKTVNEIEEFRYRIEDDKVYCYDSVGAGPTIFREDETFGYGFFDYYEDIEKFMSQAKIEADRVRAERGLKFTHAGEDIIHYSTLPWADFTAVNHARVLTAGRSIPKITFGKITREGDNMWLPVDIHANHALMDGFHVGKFVERFQELLKEAL
jgi:chloramphenicol O-acetyltransferase type A